MEIGKNTKKIYIYSCYNVRYEFDRLSGLLLKTLQAARQHNFVHALFPRSPSLLSCLSLLSVSVVFLCCLSLLSGSVVLYGLFLLSVSAVLSVYLVCLSCLSLLSISVVLSVSVVRLYCPVSVVLSCLCCLLPSGRARRCSDGLLYLRRFWRRRCCVRRVTLPARFRGGAMGRASWTNSLGMECS